MVHKRGAAPARSAGTGTERSPSGGAVYRTELLFGEVGWMDMLVNGLAMCRQLMLQRQAAAVLKAVRALDATQRKTTADQTLAEIQAASVLPHPHWHGASESMLYRPWSPVASVTAGRVRDRSIQLRQRSVALWLAVVYHE